MPTNSARTSMMFGASKSTVRKFLNAENSTIEIASLSTDSPKTIEYNVGSHLQQECNTIKPGVSNNAHEEPSDKVSAQRNNDALQLWVTHDAESSNRVHS